MLGDMPSIATGFSSDPAVGEVLTLVDDRDGSSVTLAPHRGALVTSFRVGGRELLYLDPATLADPTKNVRGGIPILFPSPGRLEGDRWRTLGRAGAMLQHGFVRSLPWTVAATSTEPNARVSLTLESSQDTRALYPWDFHNEFSFELDRSRLRITARVHNASSFEMPFALGFHPYFQVDDKPGAQIASGATEAFDNVQKQVVPFTGFDFSAPELDMHLVDHGTDRATLALADGSRIELRASADYSWWVVWSVAGKDYVCLEPWTAPGNALNTGDRLLMLDPGATHESWIELSFTASAT
jgi:galactose mutarotase-like enzyme